MRSIKPIFKYISSTSHVEVDGDGNIVITRIAKNDGSPQVLKFILRTDSEIQRSRIRAYPILIP
jgi:hypothetical protein